jgi:DNA-binding CsgD family transcriptional regulator
VDPFQQRVRADGTAHEATWDAERGRSAGTSSATLWAHAASEWDRLQRPHRAAYSRWRQAEALLARSESRHDAASVLIRAAAQAHTHRPLTEAIEALAGRAGVTVRADIPGPSDQDRPRRRQFALTDRELDVLRLISEGRSNREIGIELYMSPKTASVHVTNILRKLGVETRAHAATVAARRGLVQ